VTTGPEELTGKAVGLEGLIGLTGLAGLRGLVG
jgi:hypothetical protein